MSKILDNIDQIRKLDSKNMLGSIQSVADQVKEIAVLARAIKSPAAYKKARQVVVVGMGGSSLGAHVLSEVFRGELEVAVDFVRDYHLPAYVDRHTLLIASSYSGTTEEVLSAVREAKKRDAMVMVLTNGGELAVWAKDNRLPILQFSTDNNPCGSPRMGLGYTLFGQAALWASAGLIKFGDAQFKECIEALQKYNFEFGTTVSGGANQAKNLAEFLDDRSVWYLAAGHLSGSAHVAANQINENAKRFAGYYILPELNHHLLEGMMNPRSNRDDLGFVIFESDLYEDRIQKRVAITKEILQKNQIKFSTYKFTAATRLGQACEALTLSSYVSFYSAILDGIDPTAIPYVDYLKQQLKGRVK